MSDELADEAGAGTTGARPLRVNVALLIALVPAVAVAARVWLYSGGDFAFFLTLIRTLNVVAILIATCVSLIPFLVIIWVWILLTDWKARDALLNLIKRGPWGPIGFATVLFIWALTAHWVEWAALGVYGLLIGLYFLVKRLWRWGYQNIGRRIVTPRGQETLQDSAVLVVTLIALVLLVPRNMWLPLELVEVNGFSNPEIAYVLESTSEWTTLVTPERRIDVIPTARVTNREVCRSMSPTLTLATIVFPVDVSGAPGCGN